MDPPLKRVSKACDACKLRKVKCNGQERCQQCTHLGLKCIYSIPTRPRTQGKRGRIITEYKAKTGNAGNVISPILAASPGGSEYGAMFGSGSVGVGTPEGGGSPPRLHYSQAFFLDLLPEYVEAVYPVHPIIPEMELRTYIQAMDTDPEVRSFVYSFGACTLNLTRYGDRRTEEVLRHIETLCNYSIDTMRPVFDSFRCSVMRAMQSVFIHNCLMTMQASDAAFYYMRDAITIIQLLRIDNKETMAPLSPSERARRQRLYWQAFIHERFVAILDYRLAILPPLESLPEDDPTIPLSVHEGFNQIIKLFSLLDTDFLKNWLGNQNPGSVPSSWIELKSRELEGDDEAETSGMALLSTMQRADLAITREWLRTLVWRLAMSQALLSSRSSKTTLSLLFPVRLSQNLRKQVTSMSRDDIEVHGSSIVQKLFEITDTIADVLIHVPAPTLEETALRIDDYLFILDFVLLFPTLDQTRRGILTEKLERLQAMFPEVVSTASSPNIPGGFGDMQSPPNDPWYHITQSKMPELNMMPGPGEMSFDLREGLAPLAPILNPEPAVQSQKAAWNHISRRLSTVNVPH
ncbi:hypothetical protein BDV96DRAFT_649188 [Lophiotrema nucula]|uniref:Zn(2)-C6 fungal-type domain-containing protein n=1 Tax=Lophiotrema nucula TaxID=690887 RepID=A0A6A5Z0L8_9PLEO|nr:hypothetical protein BDV96DRAFT_649188 [Lophiotrema nucula]